ncbi:MAG: phage tail tape measure protein [Alphaproteobacteria bacterium]|nr:phage tail tape measure protein [Alphaproteobacteria bacterium]
MDFGKGVSIHIGAVLTGWQQAVGTVTRDLAKIGSATNQLKDSFFELGQATAVVWSVGKLVNAAGDLEEGLMDAAITADMTDEAIGKLRKTLSDLSKTGQTNQSMNNLLVAFKSLTAAGLDVGRATESLYAIGRAATASGASIEDMSETAFVLINTLGVAPGDLSAELDRLAYAGKQGSFELRDMARSFPALGASVKFLGLKGTEAVATMGAALQIAKLGAADPSQAANNMANFLNKIAAPETLQKFEEHGVNLKRVLADAMKNGENPMEAMLAQIDKMLGTDETKRMFRLGELFQDAQVQAFLRPMLSNMGEYKKLKDGIAASSGTIDADYGRKLGVANQKIKGFTEGLWQFGEAIGKSFIVPVGAAVTVLTPVLGLLTDFAGDNPVTTASITTLGAAIMILPAALKLASVAVTMFGNASKVAFIFNPIGLAIMAIGLGVLLLIDNWDRLKAAIGTAISWVRENFTTILKFMGPVGWAVSALIENWDSLKGAVGSAVDFMSAKLGALVEWFEPIITRIGNAWAFITNSEAPKAPAQSTQVGRALSEAQARGSDLLASAAPRGQAANAFTARGGSGSNGRVQVQVDFANVPKGVAVNTESSGGGLDMTAKTGYALGAFG